MRWWLTASPVLSTVASRLTRVIRWGEWADRPGTDLGTDLVGWDEAGRLWAVQCKAYQPSHYVDKGEVSDLVADSPTGAGAVFYRRIFITTSDGYTKNAKTIAERNDVLLLARADLEATADILPWPASEKELRELLNGKVAQIVRRTPLPHQQSATEQVTKHLEASERAQLLMACGTGKTLTSLWIKERLLSQQLERKEQRRVLVLLPSISLLAQTLREWAANRGTEWTQLAVCSDKTASSSRAENYDDLEAVSAGFPVTTSQHTIREFLRDAHGEHIVFSTYQSSAEVAAAARAEGVTFDLVICDEAHRLAGQAGKSFASVLDDTVFSARKRLFMTATPKIFSPAAKRRANDDGYSVASMDDHAKFGEVAHSLTFGEAIKKGLLTDYQVVIAVTTDTKAKEFLAENRFIGLDDHTLTASDLAAAIAVAKAAKRHKITRVISFHSTIRRSKQFVDTIEMVCDAKLPGAPRHLSAHHVDGSVSAKERQRQIDHLKAASTGFNLLANAKCLTEGIDVPALDGVAFADPRQSEVDIVQAVGRAIRLSPDKEKGTIVIPVVCSTEEAAEGRLDEAGHKKLRQVLWALRAHDAHLAVEIDDFVFAQALSAAGSRKSDVPEKIKIEFDGDDLKGFAATIRTSVLRVGSPDADWAERYAAVQAFWIRYNRWPSQHASGAEGLLAGWLSNQRVRWKQGRLSLERSERLQALEGWSWTPQLDEWVRSYADLSVFLTQRLHWPVNSAGGTEGRLATWIGNQRRARSVGSLPPERIKRLESLPGWSWDPSGDEWERNYHCLADFRAEQGRLPRKNSEGEEGRLAHWATRQRRARDASKLDVARVKRLESLPGWSWDPARDQWERNFTKLRNFRNEHKQWPRAHQDGEEGALAKWVARQRATWAAREVLPEYVQRLESLPGWSWDPARDQWEQNLADLAAFREAHDRWPAASRGGGEARLARWMESRRQDWKMGRLSPERIKRLESLPGWSWDPARDQWEQNLADLKSFCNQNKRWPDRGAAGREGQLATWMSNQRRLREAKALPDDRQAGLESLPGWSWRPSSTKLQEAWNQDLDAVLLYYARHNCWPVSKRDGEEGRLGLWMKKQRHARRAGALSEEQVERLNSIPGWPWEAAAVRMHSEWQRNFSDLEAFLSEYAVWPAEGRDRRGVHTQRVNATEVRLARWVIAQREAWAVGTLSTDRAQRLESIPGWTWSAKD